MKSQFVKSLYLVRHGQTKWSITGQHTGATNIPLTAHGYKQAKFLKKKLHETTFELILTSPLIRCLETCTSAGFFEVAEVDDLLVEWDYGIYEGWTKQQILAEAPTWNIFADGAPQGESVEDVKIRALYLLQRVLSSQGNVLIFSHGHFLRLFLTLWLKVPCKLANIFMLSPASVSILSINDKIQLVNSWNDVCHLH